MSEQWFIQLIQPPKVTIKSLEQTSSAAPSAGSDSLGISPASSCSLRSFCFCFFLRFLAAADSSAGSWSSPVGSACKLMKENGTIANTNILSWKFKIKFMKYYYIDRPLDIRPTDYNNKTFCLTNIE